MRVFVPPQYDRYGNREVWFFETGRDRFDEIANGALLALVIFAMVLVGAALSGGVF